MVGRLTGTEMLFEALTVVSSSIWAVSVAVRVVAIVEVDHISRALMLEPVGVAAIELTPPPVTVQEYDSVPQEAEADGSSTLPC